MTDEVLVHISTAATRENDELFRSLADAYNAFQPCRIHHNEFVRKRAKSNQPIGLSPNADLSWIGGSITGETGDPLVLTGSKDSYGSFPSNLSPEEQNRHQSPDPIDDDSIHPTSRLAQLDRSYLSWRKHASPRLSFTCSQRELQKSSVDLEDADTGFIEDSQLAVQVSQSQQVDANSMTSADTSDDESIQDEITTDTKNRPPQRAKLIRKQYSELTEEVQLPAASKDALADLEGCLSVEPPDCPIHEARAFERKDHACVDQPDFSTLPFNAFPPAPTISVACPKILPSQITKHLAAIKTKNSDRFQPLRMRRTLDADERGYWLVDCMKWSPEVQWDFWSLLCNHVCSGRIGWGTTLHRETESGHSLGCVRLYSWGEVAEHMWILLWLCSKGKVSGSGTKWFDANDAAVLEVL